MSSRKWFALFVTAWILVPGVVIAKVSVPGQQPFCSPGPATVCSVPPLSTDTPYGEYLVTTPWMQYTSSGDIYCPGPGSDVPANADTDCWEAEVQYQPSSDSNYLDDLRTLDFDTKVRVRRSIPNGPTCSSTSKGTVILSTGGGGSQFYYQRTSQHKDTVQNLVNACLAVFEVAFTGRQDGSNKGILHKHDDKGYRKPYYAYAAAVREILSDMSPLKVVTTSGKVCAQGNSGGSAVIGYGLAAYDLDNELDVAIMTAGPRQLDSLRLCDAPTAALNPVAVDWTTGNVLNGLICDTPRINLATGAALWDDQMGLGQTYCQAGDLATAASADLDFAQADGILSYGVEAEYRQSSFLTTTTVYVLYGADEGKNNDAGAAIWTDCYPQTIEDAAVYDVNAVTTDDSGFHAFDSQCQGQPVDCRGAGTVVDILTTECVE